MVSYRGLVPTFYTIGTAVVVAMLVLPAPARGGAPGAPAGSVAAPSAAGTAQPKVAPPSIQSSEGSVRDTPAAAAAWDRGLDALVRGDLDLAAAAFGEVVAQSGNDGRRTTARDLIDRMARAKAEHPAGAPQTPQAGSAATGGATAPATLVPPTATARTDRRAPHDDEGGLNHEGRVATLAVTTALGLGLYGWAVPQLLDLDGRGYVGMYMLVAGASFAVPYLLTWESPVTWPMTGLGFWGGTRGIAHGAMMAAFISPNSTSEQGLAASMLIGSTTELIAGLAWGSRGTLTPGGAHTVGVAGDVGLLVAMGLGHATTLDRAAGTGSDTQLRTLMGMGLAGTVGGVVGGWWLSGQRERSFGDIEVTRAAGVIGAWTGATVAIVANVDDSRLGVGSLMLGGIAGLVAGDHLVRDTNFSFAQGVFVDLGTLAGGLAGAGLAYLIIPDISSPKPYFVASTIGAAGGFTLLTLTQLDTARARRRAGVSDADSAPRLALFPTFGRDGHRGLSVGGAF